MLSSTLEIRNTAGTSELPKEITELASTSDYRLNCRLFSDLLRKSVVCEAESVLGKTSAAYMLYYLRLDTIGNILEVSTLLRSMCGDLGASIVERAIVKELFRRLNINYDERYDLDLAGSIELALEMFTRRRTNTLPSL